MTKEEIIQSFEKETGKEWFTCPTQDYIEWLELKLQSENERLKAALTEIKSVKVSGDTNRYMYAFNKCYHIADKALESQPPKQ